MRKQIDIPKGWIPLSEAVAFIERNTMTKDVIFVLDNWDYKYLNLRVDMRTGMATIQPGNKR